MLYNNGQYPDLKLTALLLKLAIYRGCSQLVAAFKFLSNRGTPPLNLVPPRMGLGRIFAGLKQRADTTFDLVVDTNQRLSAALLCRLLPCFNF